MGSNRRGEPAEWVPSDAGLWSRTLDGENAAFGVLYDRHRDRVFRHALRLVSERTSAEDATGTAFLELWRRRQDVRLVQESVLPWLLVTTTNVARNTRRGLRRYRALLDSLPRSEPVPDVADLAFGDDPLTQIDVGLAASLRRLAPMDLRLLTLVALEGYGLPDAASLLGLSEPAARSRLHRARTRIRSDRSRSDGGTAWTSTTEGSQT
jgi:RNA polymerase sigma factor (sigma-70 family)